MCIASVRSAWTGRISLVIKFDCGYLIPRDAAHLTENITVYHCGRVV